MQCFEQKNAVSSILCQNADITLRVVDVGVKDYTAGDMQNVVHSVDETLNGTNNYCNGNAMTREDVERCYNIGCENVQKCNTNVIIFGEVGIGNTTTSSTLLCFLTHTITHEDVSKLCGPGATTPCEKINESTTQRKIELVERAISLHYEPNQDIWTILQKVGGAEIVSIVGGIIQASKMEKCILLDGFIVTVAALVAIKLYPKVVSPCLFFSTQSKEPGHVVAIRCILDVVKENGFPASSMPALDMGLRLGEGSGAVLAFPLLRSCVGLFHGVATLEQVLSGDKED